MGGPPALRYTIGDGAMTCRECGHDSFYTRRTLLNTKGLTLLGFEMFNQEAVNFVCEECGHLTWFMERTPGQGWTPSFPRPVK